MLKCPTCGVRFYESTAPYRYEGLEKPGADMEKVIMCPRCGSSGPFDKIELKDVML